MGNLRDSVFRCTKRRKAIHVHLGLQKREMLNLTAIAFSFEGHHAIKFTQDIPLVREKNSFENQSRISESSAQTPVHRSASADVKIPVAVLIVADEVIQQPL